MLGHVMSRLRPPAYGLSRFAERTLNERVIRVAVTGLSRSGKTVFITSLIHNLLALGQKRNTLPRLQSAINVNGASRLRNVRIAPAGAATIPRFDYEGKLADLASSEPAWPARTQDLALIALDMEIERPSPLAQKLGRRRVRLELLDYPGEWLLDLPLLSQSYRSWSEETLRLLQRPPRLSACGDFLKFLTDSDPNSGADEDTIHRGHVLYRAALEDCRRRFGLRYLQPGRFLCPGPGDAPFMWFYPIADAHDQPSPGTVADLLRERFEAYKTDMRAQFFETHFADFDRQVVLVDVLSALHAGKDAFEDMEHAITQIARSLHYGTNWLPRDLGRLPVARAMLGRRIERVAFAATKADHVPSMRRENLKNLVRAMAENARPPGVRGDQRVTYHTVASVLATVDSTATIDGHPVEVVLGLPLGEQRQRPFYPGDVPSGRPPESFWSDRFFELPIFAPPHIDPSGAVGIPHLGVDEVLTALLRDVL
jgi:predicted YcjX-like family ATPase